MMFARVVFLLSIFGGARAAAGPVPFPLFLKQGFSSVVEFESVPKRVVVGDSQNFQIEKMDHALVVRALSSSAVSNMFVYFETGDPRLFVLTASDEAEPTLYKKFESVKQAVEKKMIPPTAAGGGSRGIRLTSAKFDTKKDYLTIDLEIVAGPTRVVKPSWDLVRLNYESLTLAPMKMWAERKEIQRDSMVKARFVFAKPNIPKSFVNVKLAVPLQGKSVTLTLNLGRK